MIGGKDRAGEIAQFKVTIIEVFLKLTSYKFCEKCAFKFGLYFIIRQSSKVGSKCSFGERSNRYII